MIDINSFWIMILYILGSILLIGLIVLVVKLIYTINKLNNVIDNVELKVSKLDGVFNIVDTVTDSFAIVSDRLTDCISNIIKKMFIRKKKEESEDNNEE